MDQAESLRRLVNTDSNLSSKQSHDDPSSKCRIVTISGGKGGVGKSCMVANIALALAGLGLNVGIFDADMGLANVDIMLGLYHNKDLSDVILGEAKLVDILLKGPRGIQLIPSGSGIEELTNLSDRQWHSLINQLSDIYKRFDVFLIDTAAGIGKSVINFVLATQELIMVITPEPTSLADTYGLLKVINRKLHSRAVYFLVNQASSKKEAEETYTKIETLIKSKLSITPMFLGWVPKDDELVRAILSRNAVVNARPEAPSSRAICSLVRRWYENGPPTGSSGNINIFLRRVKNLMNKPRTVSK